MDYMDAFAGLEQLHGSASLYSENDQANLLKNLERSGRYYSITPGSHRKVMMLNSDLYVTDSCVKINSLYYHLPKLEVSEAGSITVSNLFLPGGEDTQLELPERSQSRTLSMSAGSTWSPS